VAPPSASRSALSPFARLGKSGRRIGAYIKIPLGVWNANALLLKQTPDLVKDLALDVVDAILRVLDPEPQLKLDRRLAKMVNSMVNGWRMEDVWLDR
jgi:hypothetical protein